MHLVGYQRLHNKPVAINWTSLLLLQRQRSLSAVHRAATARFPGAEDILDQPGNNMPAHTLLRRSTSAAAR